MAAARSAKTRYGLPLEAVARIAAVLSDYPEILSIKVFGSRAKGNWRPGSDLDLWLEAPSLAMARRLDLENRLDDLLLPWKIDLLVSDDIDNPALLEHIARVGLQFRQE
ncbi:MAG TPA: nucleotidyltransferase domain-containing protein [Azonexus sp.]|nr:nucleotidyltransferase domain-containing protein [Azonexus sp.]